ncbi:AzlC family ABC transporter permease [Dongia mobilis]|jgi:predicted branched-subunit amino acid permease|uniref:AzlC family ABC transporter permease n=1 Tax=Dongia sp. TaxID=1977262 RepID=UPI0026EFB23F
MEPQSSPDRQASSAWTHDFGSPAGAGRGGAWAAVGAPALVLGASYVGFGAFVHQSGLTFFQGVASSITGWALPGQIALIEIFVAGGSLLAAAIAVGLANARLMPMVVTLLPILREGDAAPSPRLIHYLSAHFIALTGWAVAMQRCPDMNPRQRLPFFLGFTLVIWLSTVFCTALGFFLVEVLPPTVTLGLVFLNPLYFMLLFTIDIVRRDRRWALLIGVVLGPLLHMITPEWGLLITGLVGGSLAFLITQYDRQRNPGRGKS